MIWRWVLAVSDTLASAASLPATSASMALMAKRSRTAGNPPRPALWRAGFALALRRHRWRRTERKQEVSRLRSLARGTKHGAVIRAQNIDPVADIVGMANGRL